MLKTSLTTATLLALTISVGAQSLASQQNQPVAGQGSLFAQRPACRQLSSRPGSVDGWEAWGLEHQGQWVQFYGLEVLPSSQAHEWLEKAGLCVIGGQVIDFSSPKSSVTASLNEPSPLTDMEARNAARTERVASGDTEGSALGVMVLIGAAGWILNRRNSANHPETDSHIPTSPVTGYAQSSASEYIQQIPVALRPVADVIHEPQMTEPIDDEPSAYKVLLSNPFLSRIFYGGQRTGKTMLMAKATEALVVKGVEVYHINLASYGDEDANYFRHASASVTGDLVHVTDTGRANRLVERASKVVEAFMQTTNNAILVCDEWKYLSNKASAHAERLDSLVSRVADIIAGFESAGMKRGKAVWTAAPGIVAGNMQQAGKAVKGLEPVIVAIAPGHSEQWNGQSLTFDHQVFNQVASNYQGIFEPSGVFDDSRIALISGKWLALGDYPDLYPKDEPRQNADLLADEKQFVDWAITQKAVLITYESFKNANAMRGLSRSRQAFNEFTDYGVLAGVLVPCGEGQFKPTTATT